MDAQFDKMISMLSGMTSEEFLNKQLSDSEKQQIETAIDLMFNGLSQRNWINGGTLSEAWLAALDTVRDTVFAFMQNNPATRYARNATFDHRKKWRSMAITSLEGTRTLNCPPEKKTAWIEDANTKIQNGYEILQQIIIRFESGTARVPQQQNIIQRAQNIKTMDEREHVHEREY